VATFPQTNGRRKSQNSGSMVTKRITIFILEKLRKDTLQQIKGWSVDCPEAEEEWRDLKRNLKQINEDLEILKLHHENSKK